MKKTNQEILYFDKKGKPCTQADAVLCVIRDLDENGKVLHETEVPITDED